MENTIEQKPRKVDLRARYRSEIESWNWETIEEETRENLFIEDDCLVGSCYLGSVLHIFPSGKLWAFWTTNQSAFDMVRDEVFREELEAVAEEHGLCIGGGKGDGCDLFAYQSFGDFYSIQSKGDTLQAWDECGNLIFEADAEEFDSGLRAFMEEGDYFPDLVSISDHGNVSRYTLGE